jgi:putative spermidine/putrescine transport system permease protein
MRGFGVLGRLPIRLLPMVPGLVVYLAVYVPALVLMCVLSVQRYVPGQISVPVFTLANYVRFLADRYYLGLLVNSCYLSAIASVIAVTVAYPMAYGIVRSPWIRRLVLPVIALTFFVSAIVLLYGWIFVLARGGLLNSVLTAAGLIARPMSMLNTEAAVVIGLASYAIPFAVLVLASAINNIDESLEQAAQNLGATAWQTLLSVSLPLSFPGLLSALVLAFALSVSAVVTPLVLGGGRVPMLATQVYDSIESAVNYPFASATVVIILVAVLSLTLLAGRALAARVV